MNPLSDYFDTLRLNEKEKQILATLYERGPIAVSRLAHAAKIERTLTYKIVKELERKGFAHHIKMDTGLVYKAQDIQTVIFAQERGIRQLRQAQEQIEEKRNGKPEKTDLMVFEGVEGIQTALYYGMEEASNGELWGIYRDVLEQEFIPLLNERHLFFKKHSIKSKIIFPYSPEVARAYMKRAKQNGITTECRVVNFEQLPDSETKKLSSIEIFKNNMKIFSFDQKRAIVITDAQAIEMERVMFKMLWENAKEISSQSDQL